MQVTVEVFATQEPPPLPLPLPPPLLLPLEPKGPPLHWVSHAAHANPLPAHCWQAEGPPSARDALVRHPLWQVASPA